MNPKKDQVFYEETPNGTIKYSFTETFEDGSETEIFLEFTKSGKLIECRQLIGEYQEIETIYQYYPSGTPKSIQRSFDNGNYSETTEYSEDGKLTQHSSHKVVDDDGIQTIDDYTYEFDKHINLRKLSTTTKKVKLDETLSTVEKEHVLGKLGNVVSYRVDGKYTSGKTKKAHLSLTFDDNENLIRSHESRVDFNMPDLIVQAYYTFKDWQPVSAVTDGGAGIEKFDF